MSAQHFLFVALLSAVIWLILAFCVFGLLALMRRALLRWFLCVGLLAVPIPLFANSITGPNLNGQCFTLAEIRALGVLEWTAPGDMQGASFHDSHPGCDATTSEAASLLFMTDVGAGTLIRFNPWDISDSAAGRFQIDIHFLDFTVDFIVNTGREASAPPPEIVPPPGPPGPIPPEDLPPIVPPGEPPPDDVPPVTEIPEPASLALLGAGLGLLAAKIRQAMV